MYAYLPIPDARQTDPATYRQDTARLLRSIREACPDPKTGELPTVPQIAALIGVSPSTLYAHAAPPDPGKRKHPKPPYSLLYALRALNSCAKGTARALWGGDPED